MKYKSYTLNNLREIPQISKLTKEQLFDIEVVGRVLPFKTNNYVVNELIDWQNFQNDPMFILNFPQKGMLIPEHYKTVSNLLKNSASPKAIAKATKEIRLQLNPQPDGQSNNVPIFKGEKLLGVQHKYRETILFFPTQGQTCHSYCTFCFRWPQFTESNNLKFADSRIQRLIEYLKQHTSITDIIFTGGDPMIMSTKILERYINLLLEADLPNLKTIRIGTKSLSYWPYRFTKDNDSENLLRLFEKINNSGKHLTIMAHINHYKELETQEVQKAIKNIQNTGSIIRSQSPLLKHINDKPEIWQKMWRQQVNLGIIPYYMFIARDTGAQHYFAVPLVKSLEIFKDAYSRVSGICRTVRGPSMSTNPGKILINGVSEINGEKVIVLNFLQGRNPDWVNKPFFAKYDDKAIWLSDLEPAFDKKEFFYEQSLFFDNKIDLLENNLSSKKYCCKKIEKNETNFN
ncbi:MAG: 4Fe-4S cluster-binding domain-containing protein [Bacteroidetes bacterium]|nr:4Fe-4S cluster-binding domain-containing protein [Bacteroidota bacterium]